MKIERLLATTIMLLNRRKVTAKYLSDYFGVTVRTIYRDVETLNSSGIPVVSYQGYEGGFSIPDSYKISKQLLTFDDIISLLTLLKGINRTLKNSDVDSVIEKMVALIPSEREDEYKKQSNSFILDITPWGTSKIQDDLLSTLHKSISNSQLIKFGYTTSDGNLSKRSVEPHAVVMKSFNWYLLAYCHLRDEFRVFKLSRMRSVKVIEHCFTKRDIDPYKYLLSDSDVRPQVDVKLKFSSRVKFRIEEMFAKEMCKLNQDGTTTVSFSVPVDNWVTSTILSFGDDVEVLSPASLVEEIREKISKMRNIYTNLT